MVGVLTAVHVLVALILILAVLLQSARGTDIGSAFGGMGSQAAFGPRGTATFLSKATVVLAAVFMVTSISLAILANRSVGVGGGSILSGEEAAPAGTAPSAPATPSSPAGAPIQVQTAPVGPEPPASASPSAPAATGGAAPAAPAAPAGEPAAAPPANPSAPPAAGSSP
ncbi:MAG TPA: preprotein translocase subunit SecG [Terriglobia bacterium]